MILYIYSHKHSLIYKINMCISLTLYEWFHCYLPVVSCICYVTTGKWGWSPLLSVFIHMMENTCKRIIKIFTFILICVYKLTFLKRSSNPIQKIPLIKISCFEDLIAANYC